MEQPGAVDALVRATAGSRFNLTPDDWLPMSWEQVEVPVQLPRDAKPEDILQFKLGVLDGELYQYYLNPNIFKDGVPIFDEIICTLDLPKKVAKKVVAYDIKAFTLPPQTFSEIMAFFFHPSMSKVPRNRKLPKGFTPPTGYGVSPAGLPIVVIRQPPRKQGQPVEEECTVMDGTAIVEAGGVPQVAAWHPSSHPDCNYDEYEVSPPPLGPTPLPNERLLIVGRLIDDMCERPI
jgi:hypothetical protein